MHFVLPSASFLLPSPLLPFSPVQINGRPMHCNKRLLTGVLRDEWGVNAALVESDGSDVIGALQYGFHIAATKAEAAAISLESGMDMDLGGTAFSLLKRGIQENTTDVKHLDRAVYNVLASKFAAGLFDHPYTDESRCVRRTIHRE